MFRTLTAAPARLIVVLPLPAPLKVAVSAAPGTVAGVQLVVVFQAVLVVPSHVGSPPAGGAGFDVAIAAALAFTLLATVAGVPAPLLPVVPPLLTVVVPGRVLAALAMFV